VQWVQAQPQKFRCVENPSKIPENLGKIPENSGKDVSTTLFYLCDE